MCDRCPRVICSSHLPIPQETSLDNTFFICIACHVKIFTKPTPYRVSGVYYIEGAMVLIDTNASGIL
jgi:hypothetical protein